MQPNLLTLLSPANIIIFVIIFTRISGMIFSMPLISTYPIPEQVKIWLGSTRIFYTFPHGCCTFGVCCASEHA